MRTVTTFAAIATLLPFCSIFAQDQWSQFRGPEGNGHSQSTGLPLKWDKTNILWKTAIHDRGWSSPVIWGDQIWMTTATTEGHQSFAVCVDKNTGKILHDLPIFDVDSPMAITLDNTYATPTSVIEDGRIYVHYGTYGTACLDTRSGEILWSRRDINCDHESGAGPASSPVLIGDLLVFHVDGRDVQYVIALDTASGETAWKAERSAGFDKNKVPVHERKAYNMPALVPRGDEQQIVSVGAKAIYSYDPSNGEELWKVRHRGWSIFPKPVYGKGLVFATIDRDRPELWAIRADGSGDVSDTHVVWKNTRRMPQRVSPILVGDLLFVMDRNGYLTCLEANSGEEVWQQRLKGKFSASPIYADNRIYLFNEEGVCTVIRSTRELEVLATNSLDEEVQLMASPAVDGDALFLRTAKHLYRIGLPRDVKNPPAHEPDASPARRGVQRSRPPAMATGAVALQHENNPQTKNRDRALQESPSPRSLFAWTCLAMRSDRKPPRSGGFVKCEAPCLASSSIEMVPFLGIPQTRCPKLVPSPST